MFDDTKINLSFSPNVDIRFQSMLKRRKSNVAKVKKKTAELVSGSGKTKTS
jgi:hypothetical protein